MAAEAYHQKQKGHPRFSVMALVESLPFASVYITRSDWFAASSVAAATRRAPALTEWSIHLRFGIGNSLSEGTLSRLEEIEASFALRFGMAILGPA